MDDILPCEEMEFHKVGFGSRVNAERKRNTLDLMILQVKGKVKEKLRGLF